MKHTLTLTIDCLIALYLVCLLGGCAALGKDDPLLQVVDMDLVRAKEIAQSVNNLDDVACFQAMIDRNNSKLAAVGLFSGIEASKVAAITLKGVQAKCGALLLP